MEETINFCGSCGEGMPEGECRESPYPCGHHCNCSWVHDYCHWCEKTFGEVSMYGKSPRFIDIFDLDWHEYMHYMYLPVVMVGEPGIRMPERLEFLWPMVREAVWNEHALSPVGIGEKYVYVTARRGFATPGNPLNRPGWHADGFGTDDINYIWTDRFPTQFAVQEFYEISDDHVRSIEQFEEQAEEQNVMVYPDRSFLRLDPFVVHAAPEIPVAGERGFVKISISSERYNLRGNSHNYLFDYDWKMWSRDEIRNDPAYAGGDAGPREI